MVTAATRLNTPLYHISCLISVVNLGTQVSYEIYGCTHVSLEISRIDEHSSTSYFRKTFLNLQLSGDRRDGPTIELPRRANARIGRGLDPHGKAQKSFF